MAQPVLQNVTKKKIFFIKVEISELPTFYRYIWWRKQMFGTCIRWHLSYLPEHRNERLCDVIEAY